MSAAAAIAAFAAVMPVAAQQAPAPWVALPYPTDSGKPAIYDPQFVAKAESDLHSGCTPGLQCRLRLLGVIQNNGAVELRATAFTW
jgi:hypothetical protein